MTNREIDVALERYGLMLSSEAENGQYVLEPPPVGVLFWPIEAASREEAYRKIMEELKNERA